MKDLNDMDGNEFLDLSIRVLVRLRRAFHSDDEKQENINNILTTLYDIK